jgi:hypothetical protein
MPAAPPGSMIGTVNDANGNPLFVTYHFWDPTTFLLRDITQATSNGNRTGALIVDNLTGKAQTVTITGSDGFVKTFSVPANGVALTAAQLAANKQNNGGPLTTIQDLAGLTTLPLV